jgi:hypothetical protein
MGIVKMPLDAQTCYFAVQELRLLFQFSAFRVHRLCQFGTLLILPLLARLVVSLLALGSSLRGFRRTRMIRCVDGGSYSQFNCIVYLTATQVALSLFRPDLKNRGYQALVVYV